MARAAHDHHPRGRRVPQTLLERPTRADRVRSIEELARRGLDARQIAEQLGLRPATVNKYRRDPDGARERGNRDRYRGRCRGCGRATDGSAGPGRAPQWCLDCAPARRRRWSDEQILGAIRDWGRVTGSPPTTYDWSPASAPAGHPGAARYLADDGRWPHARTVTRRFGTLGAAIRRAGLKRG